MNPRRKRAVISALAMLAGVDLGAQGPGRRVVRRADLEAAAATRIAEVLEMSGLTRSSVDGLTFAAAADRMPGAGVSTPGTPSVLVLLDGVRMPVGIMGQTMLDWLPLTVDDIDSVVVTPGPAIVEGQIAPRGAIAFFRRPVARGPFTRAGYQFGDETGDPGPFRYTDQRTPNVEKVGPFKHLVAGYGAARWSAEGTYARTTFNSSDAIILARVPAGTLTEDRQYSELRTAAGRLGFKAAGDHHLMISRTDHLGLVFVPALGIEQPFDVRSVLASVSGQGTRRSLGASYSVVASTIDIGGFESVIPMRVAHERRVLVGGADLTRTTVRNAFTLGASAGRQSVSVDSLADERTRGWERVRLDARFGPATGTRAEVGGGVTTAGRTALDEHATFTWVRNPATTLAASFVVMHMLTESDDVFADRAAFGIADAESPDLARFALSASHRGPIRIDASAAIDRSPGWSIFTEPAPFLGAARADRAPTRAGATVLDGSLRLSTAEDRALSGSADLRWSGVVSSSSSDRTAFESVPDYELRVDVRARPFASVRLSAALAVVGPTTWTSVDASAPSARTPPVERLDLSAEKWMWQHRLRVQAAFRNVFDRPERYHPLAAQWNRRTFLSASLVIPRLD